MQIEQWQLEGIQKMMREGKSQRAISQALNVSIATVNKYCKRAAEVDKHIAKARTARRDAAPHNWGISLKDMPTEESIKTDILTLYRQTLYELSVRMPEMSNHEVWTLSSTLLAALNETGD